MTREELIAALEKAEGPSRVLDAETGYLIGEISDADRLLYSGSGLSHDHYGRVASRYYTSSIDAAMTLPPNGWRVWEMNYNRNDVWVVFVAADGFSDGEGGSDDCVQVNHARLPIAICIAALKARVE